MKTEDLKNILDIIYGTLTIHTNIRTLTEYMVKLYKDQGWVNKYDNAVRTDLLLPCDVRAVVNGGVHTVITNALLNKLECLTEKVAAEFTEDSLYFLKLSLGGNAEYNNGDIRKLKHFSRYLKTVETFNVKGAKGFTVPAHMFINPITIEYLKDNKEAMDALLGAYIFFHTGDEY